MKPRLNRKGQSIVEITLVTPILLVALYIPFDFGVMLYSSYFVQNAVRDGARRAAATDVLASSINTRAQDTYNALPGYLGSKQVTVDFYDATGGCAQSVEVTATGTYNFFWYRLLNLINLSPSPGNSITITRKTRMRYEFQPDTNGGTSGSAVTFCTGTPTSATYP